MNAHYVLLDSTSSSPVNCTGAMMFDCMLKGKTIRNVLFCVVYDSCALWYAHTDEQFLPLTVCLFLNFFFVVLAQVSVICWHFGILCILFIALCVGVLPLVLWWCWLGGRKGIWPVKNWVVGCWHGICLGEVQIYIWPSWCHCRSLSLAPVNPDWFCQNGSAFLVPAYPGCPGKKAIKRM